MKKKILVPLVALLLIFSLSYIVSPVFASQKDKPYSNLVKTEISSNVQKTRFLNMLNHNFAYNGDFDSFESLVNAAVVSMVSSSEVIDEFISESDVSAFVYDMYGVWITDFSEINKTFPKKDGYVYVVPKGYSKNSHSFVSMNNEEDGTISVVTAVKIFNHDGEETECKAVSRFIKNAESSFGYSLLSSDIIENVTNA